MLQRQINVYVGHVGHVHAYHYQAIQASQFRSLYAFKRYNKQFLSSYISLAKHRNRMPKFLDIISEYEQTKFH